MNVLEEYLRLQAGTPTTDTAITSIFEQYQKLREPRVQKLYNSVRMMTRLGTWDTYVMKFIARIILPWIDDAAAVSSLIRGASKVNFVPVPHRSKGFTDDCTHRGPTEKRIHSRTKQQAMGMYAILGSIAYSILLALGLWGSLSKAVLRFI